LPELSELPDLVLKVFRVVANGLLECDRLESKLLECDLMGRELLGWGMVGLLVTVSPHILAAQRSAVCAAPLTASVTAHGTIHVTSHVTTHVAAEIGRG
jgi:hypothetical protein